MEGCCEYELFLKLYFFSYKPPFKWQQPSKPSTPTHSLIPGTPFLSKCTQTCYKFCFAICLLSNFVSFCAVNDTELTSCFNKI